MQIAEKKNITANERIQAVLRGEKTNSPVISMWKHFPLEDRELDKFVRRTMEFQDDLGLDFIKLNYNGLYGVEDWDAVIEWPESPVEVGKVVDYPIKSVSDWNNIQSLSIDRSHALKRELDYTKRIVDIYKGKVPVLATVFSPLTIAFKLCGPDLIDQLKENPDDLHRGLSIIANTTYDFVHELIEIGIDGVFFATQLADYDKLNWKGYETYGKRYDLILLEKVKKETWFNILHIHGEQPMFKALEDYPVHAINWHDQTSTISLKEARKLTDKILIGGIDEHGILAKGTEEELRAHLKESLQQVDGHKFIFGPGCVIPLSIPEERLELVRSIVQNMKL